MTSLREKVARAIWMADVEPLEEGDCIPLADASETLRAQVYAEADAAIAIIRGETLEEAARVAEDCSVALNGTYEAIHIAAAIRALARPNNGLTEPSAEVSAIP